MAERFAEATLTVWEIAPSLHLQQPVRKRDKDLLPQPLEYLVYTSAVGYKIPVHVDNHTPVLPCP